jgi:hypothetical protein
MTINKKVSEMVAILGINVPDSAYFEIIDPTESNPDDRNKRITILELKIAIGVYSVFEATGTATTTLQDNRLIGKDLADVRQLFIGGTEQVSLGTLSSLNTVSGTITFTDNFGGAIAIITLA